MSNLTLLEGTSTVTEAFFPYRLEESPDVRAGQPRAVPISPHLPRSEVANGFTYFIPPTGTSQYPAAGLTLDSESSRRARSTEWDHEIRRLRSLQPNWDTYGAEAPAKSAIITAESLLAALGEDSLRPTRVAPSAEGGVAVTFTMADKSYMIEFFNDGDISAVWSDGDDYVDARELSLEDAGDVGWRSVLANLNEFLLG